MRLPIILAVLLSLAPIDAAFAQLSATGNFHIVWEVKNRFRLFRNENDFLRQVAAARGDGVLAAEDRLEHDTAGMGWAKDVVDHLCVDKFGTVMQTCERDGQRENYLTPADHPISVAIAGDLPQGQTCTWSFDDGNGPVRQTGAPCEEEVKLRVAYGRTTVATVDVPLGDGTAQRVVAEIAVRDVLIAGLGDSIAAGEGNPDRAVKLEGGFCYRRFLRSGGGGGQYFRPSRAGYDDDRSCENGPSTPAAAQNWAQHGARWMSPGCHRSLYSYELRTALALAVEQPHLAVTFLPLACTGATIENGLFGAQAADDCPWVVGVATCSGSAPAQFDELRDLLAAARRQDPKRTLDAMLLTIGANDMNFGGLVANVIVQSTTERLLLREGGGIASLQDSQRSVDEDLTNEFARLRTGLKPFMGNNLAHVVFVSYANPAMQAPNKPCPGGRDGLDVHPAFGADAERLRAAADFVDTKFLPKIKLLVTCDGGKACRDPINDRMTFVDSHQPTFEQHGMCAHANSDPDFDRACFSVNGESFETDLAKAADDPMACDRPASDYRPYSSRARWIRTVNDSYFTAMTYPEGMPVMLKPSDIHDALWGVLSAVYGGAVHPTAEGYAAMADAALPSLRDVLGLQPPPSVQSEPLAPLPVSNPPAPTPTAPTAPPPRAP
jgi:lysophospholipase L1-like esterase